MVESGLQSKTNISNVGMVDIGPMIILLLVALEMGLEVNFYHVLGTEELVAVETTLEESMIDTWMTDMMAGVMEIKTVITAESKFGGHDSIIVNDRYGRSVGGIQSNA